MTKINWFRPELIDANNRKREHKRLAALYNYKGPQTGNTWYIGPKGRIILAKIPESDLSNNEISKIYELFDLASKYMVCNLFSLSLIIGNKRTQRKIIGQESKHIYQNMIEVCEYLILHELAYSDRKKGLYWLLNFLKPIGRQNTAEYYDAADFWNLIIGVINESSVTLKNKLHEYAKSIAISHES